MTMMMYDMSRQYHAERIMSAATQFLAIDVSDSIDISQPEGSFGGHVHE